MPRLPRNLQFEVHKVLCLPRNLHFKVHKVPRLPRNLQFEVRKVCICYEICTWRFTKCCACHEICTWRFTTCCICYEICTWRFTKCCACHEICTSRFTKCCACHEICTSRYTCGSSDKAFCRKSASKDNIKIPKRSYRARRPPTSENNPHVEKSPLNTAPVTKAYHEICISKYKATPTPCACHKKSTLGHQSTFPFRLPRKVTTMSENARGATTRAQSRQAPAAADQILRACAVEMHFEDFET